MKTSVLILVALLTSGALALPASAKPNSDAIERELDLLNAPEPWEKRAAREYSRI
jgi:hypothetical protein